MNPITRKETFLAAAGGQDVTTPTPITREEVFLDEIAKGGGGSGGGVLVVNMAYDEQKKNYYTDKTWKEIYDAPMAVIVVASNSMKGIDSVTQVKHQNGEYSVSYYVLSPMGEITVSKLVTDSENGYLTYAE